MYNARHSASSWSSVVLLMSGAESTAVMAGGSSVVLVIILLSFPLYIVWHEGRRSWSTEHVPVSVCRSNAALSSRLEDKENEGGEERDVWMRQWRRQDGPRAVLNGFLVTRRHEWRLGSVQRLCRLSLRTMRPKWLYTVSLHSCRPRPRPSGPGEAHRETRTGIGRPDPRNARTRVGAVIPSHKVERRP